MNFIVIGLYLPGMTLDLIMNLVNNGSIWNTLLSNDTKAMWVKIEVMADRLHHQIDYQRTNI